MVNATVNVPQGLCVKAFTTIIARTARMMIIIMKHAINAMIPGTVPSSILTSSPKERASRRVETKSTIKSCTAPAITTPASNQSMPGKYPSCAAKTGPTNGPAPAIAAKW